MNTIQIDDDGNYRDEEGNLLTVEILEHSTHGTIKYIVMEGKNVAVNFQIPEGEFKLPDDWEEEI